MGAEVTATMSSVIRLPMPPRAVRFRGPGPGWRKPSRDGRLLAKSVFPIMPYERRSPDALAADFTSIGSAFFLTSSGLFLTAKHVVADYIETNRSALAVLRWYTTRAGDRGLLRCEIASLQLHPTLDVAVGVAAVGSSLVELPRPLTLSRLPLKIGDAVAVYGYSHTRAEEPGPRALTLQFWPTDHHGHVQGTRSLTHLVGGGSLYLLDAQILGGASGAPVVSRSRLEVHAVISTGIADACGFATDIRDFVDSWPIDALGGTLAAYAEEYPRELSLK
jgi:V8-like Glu-specific endopeptidase